MVAFDVFDVFIQLTLYYKLTVFPYFKFVWLAIIQW